MKKVWNGFDTNPNTLPEQCAICLGGFGGEFIVLSCGHGSVDRYPLHVGCVIRTLTALDAGNSQAARCPVCRESIDNDTLLRLAYCTRRNQLITFPDDNNTTKNEHLWQNENEQKKFLRLLLKAQERNHTGQIVEPTGEEYEERRYAPLIGEARILAQNIEQGLDGHIFSLEDIDEVQGKLKDIEHRISISAGKVALYEKAGWVSNDSRNPSFSELYERLVEVHEPLEKMGRRLCEMREKMLREEEGVV